jgi:hypothetical protein
VACEKLDHGFCKSCWEDHFTNEIEVLSKCINMKCPFPNCVNIANDDDIEGAINP